MSENVLVVSANEIRPFLTGNFTTDGLDKIVAHILSNHTFKERIAAEGDVTMKQVIPYVVVRHKEDHLLLRRTIQQSETRLHNKYSLGVGGHITDREKIAEGQNVLTAGLERELEEEVHLLSNRLSLKLVGVISDDSTPVGTVHLALVYLLEVDAHACVVNEASLMTKEWASPETLQQRRDGMESWSQIVLDQVVLATCPIASQ